MKIYLLIARERIAGITDDESLKTLNGYLERIFEVSDGQSVTDVCEATIKKIEEEFPNACFVGFEYEEIKDDGGIING